MSIFAGVSSMMQMDEGNGPSQDHMEVPSPLEVDSNAKENKIEKVTPEVMCRQINTAYKEMDVIDSIVAQSKISDLQQDYVQITETLLQKRKFLAEWISRFHCPIVDCSLHNPKINASNVNNGNNSKVNVNVKNKSKRNASQIAK
ncbi:hypothetical protein CEXT_564111 [Caerostris extrusa]|uniref:Uncharacterized protein n=1 Tax=Caerostris extrusa TaxID=172846 RepID=A0AAV4XJW3_CAEEX|nr:hypothetical protein CEXT_564111 [Caerostris extrusa]